ncbi:hypothetical protein PC129_g17907 [Phytophthora cactorum]|uniref:Uncharacterized protein n=2 Tax=Phytophthora cactorum TaxID=29920 RepID=A0A329T455_9STRA|nr:hypothetical protein Pcac1_g10478 [Phytophthora cactorum]KAG2804110.1 hypothetical protein PC111_g18402 [Phytophthora cactorum]KAG2827492.1 hypothetical protein PC112_g8826 [Phytophthora cactorum]KAG2862337.1 hypothetical protein PC113_g6393 [Phytophthora cactorum]KAG2919267.1 hypothetical protein PC114_g6501 [Phytophthora cactorum]
MVTIRCCDVNILKASCSPAISSLANAKAKALKPSIELKQDEGEARAAAREELHRQRSLVHHAGRTMKKRKIVTDLEESIKTLREAVEELRVKYQIAQLKISTTSTIWNVAAEYFQLFRNGYTTPFDTMLLQPSASPAQRKFLYSTMAFDVVGETGHGVEPLLDDWRLISLYHEDIDIAP